MVLLAKRVSASTRQPRWVSTSSAPAALASANLPTDFAPELKVIALVIDGPALVRLHVNGVVDAAEYVVKRLVSRDETHIRHPDQRQPRPAVGSHGSVRSWLTYGGR